MGSRQPRRGARASWCARCRTSCAARCVTGDRGPTCGLLPSRRSRRSRCPSWSVAFLLRNGAPVRLDPGIGNTLDGIIVNNTAPGAAPDPGARQARQPPRHRQRALRLDVGDAAQPIAQRGHHLSRARRLPRARHARRDLDHPRCALSPGRRTDRDELDQLRRGRHGIASAPFRRDGERWLTGHAAAWIGARVRQRCRDGGGGDDSRQARGSRRRSSCRSGSTRRG